MKFVFVHLLWSRFIIDVGLLCTRVVEINIKERRRNILFTYQPMQYTKGSVIKNNMAWQMMFGQCVPAF